MENVNQPSGHDPQEHQPTQPFRFTPGWPSGSAGYGQVPYGQQPGSPGQPAQPQPGPYGPYTPPGGPYDVPGGPYAAPDGPPAGPGGPYDVPGGPYDVPGGPYSPPGGPYSPPPSRFRSRKLRWGAGIAAAALLAAGGTVAGLKLAGGSSAPANSTQATALNNELSTGGVSTTCPASAGSQSGQSGQVRCHHRHLHLLRLVRGMYGEVAFYTPGGTRTLAFERGTVESVSGSQVTVRARNGTTWTWTLVSDSVVRKDGQVSTRSELAKGERVFAGGLAVSGAKDIRLIIIRTASGSSGASGSQSPA